LSFKFNLSRRLLACGLSIGLMLFLPGLPARADRLVLAQVAELSGQDVVAENTAGARLWFDHLNADPGQPHHWELRPYDDRRDPARTLALVRQAVQDDGALALFGLRSTPSLNALAPVLDAMGIPLVAPFNGSGAIRGQARNAFFLRGTYADEAHRLIAQFDTMGLRRLALVCQSDAFGQEGCAGFQAALHGHGLAPALTLSYDRNVQALEPVLAGLEKAKDLQAVMMACTPAVCARLVRQLREAGLHQPVALLSNANSQDFVSAVGPLGQGVLVSQVMPYPFNQALPLVREFMRLNSQRREPVAQSYASLEGFAAARLLSEAVRRAGPHPGRESLIATLRNSRDLDLGGWVYQPSQGGYFTDITVLDARGRLLH